MSVPSVLRVAAAQINPTVGDLEGNRRKILEWIEEARRRDAQLVAFPEMALCGYPPKDLLLKPHFLRDVTRELEKIIPATSGMLAVVGLPVDIGDVYNAAAVIYNGELLGYQGKTNLPNYQVFDEKRYFSPSTRFRIFETDLVRFGVTVCEDLWYPQTVAALADTGIDLLIGISASPFSVGKPVDRRRMLQTRATDHQLTMLYVNQVGGQDELIFDGRSLVIEATGRILGAGKAFEEDLLVTDVHRRDLERRRLAMPFHRDRPPMAGDRPVEVIHSMRPDTVDALGPALFLSRGLNTAENPFLPDVIRTAYDPIEDAYRALVLGVHDYVCKNGFRSVVVGLSGGIDSALTAVVAVDALGPEAVSGISMPSRYSSDHSKSDARQLSENLGIDYREIPIEDPFSAFLDILAEPFEGRDPDVTEENMQARIRGQILMALSNKFGHLVLTTGNKSELAVGYATLYGDMCGGLAVLSDVPKTWVYAIARHLNEKAGTDRIPKNIVEKPPSAELREDQYDTDSLPDYDVLDGILHAYIERDYSIEDITGLGYDLDTVHRVIRMVDLAEYKRRQAAIGIRITSKAFGTDRRLPITNAYREEG